MNRLSGELPAQIGKLKHLETLAALIMNWKVKYQVRFMMLLR
jgi:hypothetical protein